MQKFIFLFKTKQDIFSSKKIGASINTVKLKLKNESQDMHTVCRCLFKFYFILKMNKDERPLYKL